MPVTESHISVTKRMDFLLAFETKVKEFERLVHEGARGDLPGSSVQAFLAWSKPEIGVVSISRDGFYKKTQRHAALRKRFEDAREILQQPSPPPSRTENTIARLKCELKEALRKLKAADTLAVTAKADLRVARVRISALENQLRRRLPTEHNVVPFSPPARREKPR